MVHLIQHRRKGFYFENIHIPGHLKNSYNTAITTITGHVRYLTCRLNLVKPYYSFALISFDMSVGTVEIIHRIEAVNFDTNQKCYKVKFCI